MLKPRLLTSIPVCHWMSAPSLKEVADAEAHSTSRGVPADTFLHAENSEVSCVALLVAVAVMTCPTGTAKGSVRENTVLPSAAVVTRVAPWKVWPSPLPYAAHEGLEKNSIEK